MKNIAILGSTGSIGTQTLEVVRENADRFAVKALAAYHNDQLLEQQIREFQPELAVLVDEEAANRLQARYKGKTIILSGKKALINAAILESIDVVVTSLVGFAGLEPTVAAIRAGKDIALANKETLVVAGEIIMNLAKEYGVEILPVDSEHSALFQCLQGEEHEKVAKIILTCSGGPFRGRTHEELLSVSIADCLNHPNWAMGKKITTDSATLANKGLEVIEAKWLYDVDYDQIEVVVHPQSIIHSMIEYVDGAVMAQLGVPDMKLPIQYALTYPHREVMHSPKLDLFKVATLTFEKPDTETFEALALAYRAGKTGGSMPCVFNAANEIAVNAFLEGKISFLSISKVIKSAMNNHTVIAKPNLADLYQIDAWTRNFAQENLLNFENNKND
ncbi:1-deoxy-D-xylulose-5-phosphate reductoisomerase [Anaerosinus sp.]|uniref:1-deoxy-D-xylulose-5-phosphate reductoisomerase n=1 Tax=Selenobaculum sp. TaxID=3074374 RepID=UPI0015B079E1